MKFNLIVALSVLYVSSFYSCHKVDHPNIPVEGVDTLLYPGIWAEYTIPTFGENTNTLRNVLIEEFTGHHCGNCPTAAEIGKELSEDNPGRVFTVAIHMGPNGDQDLQKTTPDYPYDFTTREGYEMSIAFSDFGFFGLPRGTVNRIPKTGSAFMLPMGHWIEHTIATLDTPLEANIQAKSNYYEETNGVFLHVETAFLENLSGEYGLVVYAIQNEVISPQLVGAERDEDYHHHNVHIGNVFGETWGRTIASGDIQSGTKITTNLSYEIPEGLSNEDIHFQIFVYNKSTYEILQVVKHEF